MKQLLLYPIILSIFLFLIGCNSCNKDKEPVIDLAETDLGLETHFDGVLTVLQFNIWQEGTAVPGGFNAIVDEVLNTKADLVALSEVRNYDSQNLAERLVNALADKGHTYYSKQSEDTGILSKFPIISQEALYPLKNDRGTITKAIVKVAGTSIAFYSAHLDYTHYACYLPRGYDGITWEKLAAPILEVDKILEQNLASERDEAIAIFVSDALKEKKKGNLVLLGGDFNEPSHLDWGEQSKNLFDHNGTVVPWQNSITLQDKGLLDAYRVRYPDPVSHPGLTWPANNIYVPVDKLAWTPEADDRDRIDFIYFYPDERLELLDVILVGPIGAIAYGERITTNPGQDTFLEPNGIWPSDHKGVLATFNIKNILK